MTYQLTDEQLAAVELAATTKERFAINARAGAAKTTTLVEIARALPHAQILCIAFNKKIAEEMTERLPKNCRATTLHSLGYRAWKEFTGKKPNLVKSKTYGLLRAEFDGLHPEDAKELSEEFSDILDIISKAKASGYLPSSATKDSDPRSPVSLLDREDFFLNLPRETSDTIDQIVDNVLLRSWEQALEGEIDFDDMVYCPALCPVKWPAASLYLVDEAQDLSALNHHVLKRMVKGRRIIIVGDPFQAIYGFRGADSQSMQKLINLFDMKQLYLTVSFRCGKEIIRHARWRAPDMKFPDWQIEGRVVFRPDWSLSDLSDDSVVICRNNAPLFKLAVLMIQHGLMPEIVGRDIVKPLEKIMRKLGKPDTPRETALVALDEWKEKELKRARDGAKGAVRDKASCISVMLNQTETVGDALAYFQYLMNRGGRIQLMTGHKSKGLEFDRVFFLEPQACNLDHEQDRNIKYVIETRAKEELNFVKFDGLAEAEE